MLKSPFEGLCTVPHTDEARALGNVQSGVTSRLDWASVSSSARWVCEDIGLFPSCPLNAINSRWERVGDFWLSDAMRYSRFRLRGSAAPHPSPSVEKLKYKSPFGSFAGPGLVARQRDCSKRSKRGWNCRLTGEVAGVLQGLERVPLKLSAIQVCLKLACEAW